MQELKKRGEKGFYEGLGRNETLKFLELGTRKERLLANENTINSFAQMIEQDCTLQTVDLMHVGRFNDLKDSFRSVINALSTNTNVQSLTLSIEFVPAFLMR